MRFDEKHKQKLRENHSKYWLGKKRPGYRTNNGKKFSEEWKRKISLSHKGDKNPSWKGGISFKLQPMVLIRDNYTCQICGLSDKEIMEVDHIIPRIIAPQLYKELSNLMTLCPNCHRRKTKRDRKNIVQFNSNKEI